MNLAEEQVQVVNIIPDGTEARDGRLKPMDKIIGIMDEKNKTITDLIGWDLDEVVKLIRGHSENHCKNSVKCIFVPSKRRF